MNNRTSIRPGTDNIFVNIDEQRLVAHGRHVRSIEIRRLIRLALNRLLGVADRPVGSDRRSADCH